MTPSYLRLRFENDGDGTGKLVARAAANAFAGEGGAYSNIDEIEEFAKALSLFPLPPEDKRRSIAGGYLTEGLGELDEHLGISVYLADVRRGYIGVQVRIATPLEPDSRPESKHQVVLEVLTTYEPLSRFSKDLLALLRGAVKEAVLQGQ